MVRVWLALVLAVVVASCAPQRAAAPEREAQKAWLNLAGGTIGERFQVPQGFERVEVSEGSFAHYLRNLPLKPHGSEVRYYDGRVKPNAGAYEAVVQMDIGTRDLQQCADAVMRLRAEYLYGQGRFNEIWFEFANGFRAEYAKWMEGYRIWVEGNTCRWVKRSWKSNNYTSFREYLDMVFAYANTVSLRRQLVPVAVNEVWIGDVFVDQGHAVIVVDLARDRVTGKKLIILAQSYMPAQEIHVLANQVNQGLSPWFEADFGDALVTPEWTFRRADLRRFPSGWPLQGGCCQTRLDERCLR
ncbi:MAG: DUF4846 domain-containing protein, partial [Bacillota bacterium]